MPKSDRSPAEAQFLRENSPRATDVLTEQKLAMERSGTPSPSFSGGGNAARAKITGEIVVSPSVRDAVKNDK